MAWNESPDWFTPESKASCKRTGTSVPAGITAYFGAGGCVLSGAAAGEYLFSATLGADCGSCLVVAEDFCEAAGTGAGVTAFGGAPSWVCSACGCAEGCVAAGACGAGASSFLLQPINPISAKAKIAYFRRNIFILLCRHFHSSSNYKTFSGNLVIFSTNIDLYLSLAIVHAGSSAVKEVITLKKKVQSG
jgi:hypothetical protein